MVDAAYRHIEAAPNPDFVPESSSFRLSSVDGVSVVDIWTALSSHVRARCAEALGPRVAIDVDQCWVRRQYPPGFAPPRHRPHRWHQDGALGFDFAMGADAAVPDDAVLRMVTCWVALTPCGIDAPGLDIVTDRVGRMLLSSQLADVAVDVRWPTTRRIQPTLGAGDAAVFGGDLLHRTHVTAAMTGTRTSIELRCFQADAIPVRLARDEFVAVPARTVSH